MHPVGIGRYDAMYILLRSLCSSSEANHESCSSDALLHAQQRKCKESDALLYTASRAACRGLASAGHVRRRALLNRQRTGRGAYVDSSPFYVHEAAEGALSCLLSSAFCSSLLSSSRTFGCSRPVLLVKSIVALTLSVHRYSLLPLACSSTLPTRTTAPQTVVRAAVVASPFAASIACMRRENALSILCSHSRTPLFLLP